MACGVRAGRALARRLRDVRAVLFDRDDTLIRDVPRYNGDPTLVQPIPGAAEAVGRLRAAGLPTGVVSNQSGIGRGFVSHMQVQRVNARVDALVGPFDTWQYCPHAPADACTCRKPAPGLVVRAARALGVEPHHTVLIGDIGTDVRAARAAGAVGILVPSPRTLPAEVREAPLVARSLGDAVDLVLAGLAGAGVATAVAAPAARTARP
ncbi:MAG: HAD family hydrolase [Candidatus Nanopelagicales bacterium]|jgi:histidinol-phosphate phosphatase family protein|nr:HAD family hydrolase [Candidatus Nanopelagicales bacterium]